MKFAKFLRTLFFKNALALFTVHEKEAANEAWVEPSQTYMMEFFAKTVKLLALNYFLKNILS